jgi:tRNA (adenine22-N1)-methyltransferase
MRLSDRLETILSVMEKGETLLDVGCDHGYLGIEAVRRGIVKKAICSDVRKGPLERAKAHILEAGLADKIELRLVSGMNGFDRGEADLMVIAGMRGMLMGQILETAWADPENGVHELHQMILEPQSDLPFFRELIRKSPMKIRDEILVQDRGKWYFIFDVCPKDSVTAQEEDNSFFSFSLLRRKDRLYRQYLGKALQKNESLLTSMAEEGENLKLRRKELLTENEKIREVIDQWY